MSLSENSVLQWSYSDSLYQTMASALIAMTKPQGRSVTTAAMIPIALKNNAQTVAFVTQDLTALAPSARGDLLSGVAKRSCELHCALMKEIGVFDSCTTVVRIPIAATKMIDF